jgi:hypothetical protein
MAVIKPRSTRSFNQALKCVVLAVEILLPVVEEIAVEGLPTLPFSVSFLYRQSPMASIARALANEMPVYMLTKCFLIIMKGSGVTYHISSWRNLDEDCFQSWR